MDRTAGSATPLLRSPARLTRQERSLPDLLLGFQAGNIPASASGCLRRKALSAVARRLISRASGMSMPNSRRNRSEIWAFSPLTGSDRRAKFLTGRIGEHWEQLAQAMRLQRQKRWHAQEQSNLVLRQCRLVPSDPASRCIWMGSGKCRQRSCAHPSPPAGVAAPQWGIPTGIRTLQAVRAGNHHLPEVSDDDDSPSPNLLERPSD